MVGKNWTEAHLPPEYLELSKKKHLPMPGRVGYGEHPVILVIDMARAWIDLESPMGADTTKAIANIKKYLISPSRLSRKCPFSSVWKVFMTPVSRGLPKSITRRAQHLPERYRSSANTEFQQIRYVD